MDDADNSPTSVRIDKFLWAVRVFASRGDAAEACRAGRVKIGGAPVKPAREVRVGETVVVAARGLTQTFLVLKLLEKRVGAKLAPDFVENKTPPEEIHKALERAKADARPKGSGRPTRRERQAVERFLGGESPL